MAQHILLLNVIFLGLGLTYLALKWPTKRFRISTFSEHASTTRAATAWYCLLFVATHIAMTSFMAWWFIPTFSLPAYALLPVATIFIFQTACTLVPYRPRSVQNIIHLVLAVTGALFIPVSLVTLMIAPSVFNDAHMIILLIALAVIIANIIVNVAWHKEIVKSAQLVHYSCFFLPLLLITYC